MNIFIEVKEMGWFTRLTSGINKRFAIIEISKTLLLEPGKKYRNRKFFNRPSQYLIIDMTAKTEEFIIENILTKDDIELIITVKVTFKIIDSHEKIMKVIENLRSQIDILELFLSSKLNDICTKISAENIKNSKSNISNTLNKELGEFQDNSFQILKTYVNIIDFKDIEIEKTHSKSKQEIQKIIFDEKVLKTKNDIDIETLEDKEQGFLRTTKLDRDKLIHQIAQETIYEEFKIEIENKRNEAKLKNYKSIATLLESDSGKLAIYPEHQFNLEIEKIKLIISNNNLQENQYKHILELIVNNPKLFSSSPFDYFVEMLKRNNININIFT